MKSLQICLRTNLSISFWTIKWTVKAIPQQIQMHAYKNQVNNIHVKESILRTMVCYPILQGAFGQDDCPGPS